MDMLRQSLGPSDRLFLLENRLCSFGRFGQRVGPMRTGLVVEGLCWADRDHHWLLQDLRCRLEYS